MSHLKAALSGDLKATFGLRPEIPYFCGYAVLRWLKPPLCMWA